MNMFRVVLFRLSITLNVLDVLKCKIVRFFCHFFVLLVVLSRLPYGIQDRVQTSPARISHINLLILSYGIVGMTWRSFVLSYLLVAAYCVAHTKPCMLCFVMRRPACWSWFFELYCRPTCQLLRLSAIVIKNIIIIIIVKAYNDHRVVIEYVIYHDSESLGHES